MKCLNCGNEIKDTALFCTKCGMNLSNNTYNKNKNKIFAFIISSSIITTIIVVAIFINNTNSYKKPIKNLEDGINNNNELQVKSTCLPQEFINSGLEYQLLGSDIVNIRKSLEILPEYYRSFITIKANIIINNKEKMSSSQLAKYNMDSALSKYGVQYSKRYYVYTNYNIDYIGLPEEYSHSSENIIFVLGKYKRKWYIIDVIEHR